MAGINGFTGLIGSFPRGTTVPLVFTLVDGAGAAIDVTDAYIYLKISTAEAGAPGDTEVTISPSDAVGGVFTGEITDTDSLALTAGTKYYDLKYLASDGKIYTFDQGKIAVYSTVNERIA